MIPPAKCIIPGSAGCQPAMLGSLPTNAGKLPALPNPET